MTGVTISEVGPRDGLQSIGPFVPTGTKIALVRALHAAGLRRMEIGSFVSPKAVPQMADTGEVLKAALQLDGLECTVLAPNRKGFELARAAGAHRVGLFMSITESHNKANVNRSCEDSFADLAGIVRDAVAQQMKVRFNLSCCFHCPFEGVVPEQVALDWVARTAALDPGIEIAICDTTGNAAPDQVSRVVGHAVQSLGAGRIAYHGHDTYGMGVANVAAAWLAGCTVIDAAAGGLGGCPFAPGATGNVATEDVAWLFKRMRVETGLDWPRLIFAADLAASIPGGLPGGRMRAVPAARAA